MKKAIALALSLTLSLGMLAGCGGGGGGKEPEYNGPSYDQLKVGEDYTDLAAELRAITQRTDLVGTTFARYVEEFNKLYPNIKINYEGITNYQDDMTARLSSSNWGDICMMPTNILLPDLNLYFHPLCSYDALKDTYNFASNRMFDNTVYGIPSTGNAQGVIYNKKVAEAAGYTSDADYCFGVNKYASQDNKIASMLYIKWFTESSNFSFDQGGVPIVKGSPYPDSLAEFEGIELIEDTPAPTELADLQPNVNRESEMGVNTDNTHVQRIVEAVVTGNETLDDIIADWNAKWNAAVDRYAPSK